MIVLITATLLLICAPLVWWYVFVLGKYESLKNIPGPAPLPILGNVLQLGTSPEDFYTNLTKFSKQYGDVFKIYVGPELKIFIANPDLLESILTSNVHITKSDGYELLAPWLGDGILLSSGKKWKSRRKLITPTFHFKILEHFVEIFNSCGDILVQILEPEIKKGYFDLFPHLNLCSFDMICRTSMGIEHSFQEGNDREYVEAVRDYLNIAIKRFFTPWERPDLIFSLFCKNAEAHQRSLRFLNEFADNIIRKRRQDKSTESKMGDRKKLALLDMLLDTELSNEDIREEINTLLFEGHDTTSSGMAFTFLSLAQNPHIQDKVYEEIESVIGEEKLITMDMLQDLKYLDLVIKEGLRMYPSVPFVERRLQTNWSIGGYDFPKDTTLNMFIYGLHQRDKYFPQPEKFDPDRFLSDAPKRHIYSYTPFSAGPRNCVGQRFAVLGMKTIFIKILQKYKLVADPNFKPNIGVAAVLKSYNGIRVELQPRKEL